MISDISINCMEKNTTIEEFLEIVEEFRNRILNSHESFLCTLSILMFEKILTDWKIPKSIIDAIFKKIHAELPINSPNSQILKDFFSLFSDFYFEFEPGNSVQNMQTDNKIGLSNKSCANSNRNLKVLSIEFLYSVYEKLLKNEIDIKASGSFYTPKRITDYITSTAIDFQILELSNRFLSNKGFNISTIAEIENIPNGFKPSLYYFLIENLTKLRIADICCGSGAFLLSIVENLYQRISFFMAYSQRNPIDLTQSLEVKRNILNKCVFGLEINPTACLLSIFLLYLWYFSMLSEHNIEQSYNDQPRDVQCFQCEPKEFLPKHERNIRNGNALIGWIGNEPELNSTKDRFNCLNYIELNRQLQETYFSNLPEQEFTRLIPFHWILSFPDFFPKEKFDIIVGNPPYLSYISSKAEKEYLINRKLLVRMFREIDDLYEAFIIRALQLCKGIIGYIVPYNIYRSFIQRILPNLVRFDNLGEGIFQNMSGAVSIVFFKDESRYNTQANNKFEFGSYIGLSALEKLHRLGSLSYIKTADLELWKENEIVNYLLTHSKRYKDYGIKINRGEELGREAVKLTDGIPVFSSLELNPYYVSDTAFKISPESIRKDFHGIEKVGFNLSFRNRIKAAYLGKRVTIKSIIVAYGTEKENLMQILGIWNSKLFDWFHQIRYSQFEERRVNRIQDISEDYPILLNKRSALQIIVPLLISKSDNSFLFDLVDLLILELFFSEILFPNTPDKCPLSEEIFSIVEDVILNFGAKSDNKFSFVWNWIELEEKRQILGLKKEESVCYNRLIYEIRLFEKEFVEAIKKSHRILELINLIKVHPFTLQSW